jgi:DNA ligase (NAD+)
MGIGKGAIIKIKRSGMVIPLVVDVIKTVEFETPVFDNVELEWNESGIELITIGETDDQRLKQLISFFTILEADNVSEGVITQLWNAGYKTVKDILGLTKTDLESIDRFGKRKATIVYNSIQKSIKDVELPKLQHASGLFKNLGSLRLDKLKHFKTKPTIDDVVNIDGFAEASAKSYIDSYDKFFDFIKELPITISEKSDTSIVSNDLEGLSFIFTGVRRPDLVKIIESRGGKEGSSVSKNTTHLVCIDKNSSSSKMKKAIDLGIKIFDIKDLEIFLSLNK